ncbi:MAG: hypothetical protein CML06_17690 [Pseudomonadales bacterium]|nr:hypothetical protein [Pseudomonadales bacterium]
MSSLEAPSDTATPEVDPDLLRLRGLWISNCYPLEPGHYQVRTFEFTLPQLATITTLSFPDANCQQPPVSTAVVSATWDLGPSRSTEEGLQARSLDMLLQGEDKKLTSVKQLVHFMPQAFVLGMSHALDFYPRYMDWDIVFTRVPAGVSPAE